MDKCKGCKAPINWIKTSKGKSMPVDPDETTIITRGGVMYKGFVPHWATCPDAKDFKKDKEPTPGIVTLQWECPECGTYSMKGHICRECGHNPKEGE